MTNASPNTPQTYLLHLGGQQVPATGDRTFLSVDPTTGSPWATFSDATREDVERAVETAAAAFSDPAWRGLSATKRGRLLMRFGDLVRENAERLGELETRQNGKLLREMVGQLNNVPEWLYYFGGLADKVEGAVIPVDRREALNFTQPEPLGVVGVVTPWNSPMLLTMMQVAPALAAGNTVVIKPSEFTSASLLEAAALAEEAGIPAGVMNVITGGREAGEALVAHPDVAKVSFTGGTETGRAIASTVAGRLGHYTLELGGKSPNIVFADADLAAAEAGVFAGIFAAGGQTCVAGSRLLVERSIHDEFVGRLVERAKTITIGDPNLAETQLGPVSTAPQLEKVATMVDQAKSDGAEVLAGGQKATVAGFEDGLFYEPTILAGLGNESALCQNEIFGPVLAVLPFEGEEEAVRIANDSRYGLAAGVWTQNLKRAHRTAQALQAGTVWVNLYRVMTYNSPFGGYKESGIGRSNGIEAIRNFLQTKSIWIDLGDEIQDPFVLKL